MTVEEYFNDWSKVVDLKEADRILKKLSASSYVVCPKIKDIFKAFTMCSLSDMRVCIIGQDPYYNLRNNIPVATGLAFANSKDTSDNNFSPSLNVLRESVIDFTLSHGIVNFDPSLEKWGRQGVLLLNSALSCKAGDPGSHALLWRPFMKSFLTKLSMYTCGVVYVLMGTQAQSFEPYINHSSNHILKTKHPSWYARNKTRMPSDIWRQINIILKDLNGYGINWYEEY